MNIFSLKGKTALVTGASSGLGEGFVHILSKAGARVILGSRRVEKLEALAEKLGNSLALEMDVSDKDSIKKAFSLLEAQNEKIDVCINNAGIAGQTPIFAEDSDRFEEILQTNVLGTWHVTRFAVNHMKKRKIHGSIINIASVLGDNLTRSNMTGYAASKAAVIRMTENLVSELAEENIRINAIVPGLFHTPLTDNRLSDESQKNQAAENIPLKFVANPSDMEGTILFLASNKASGYMTGSCITIDGGSTWKGR